LLLAASDGPALIGENVATTKVRFTATIENDIEQWAENYGTGASARAVQKDVRAAILAGIYNMPVPPLAVMTH
jgi:hypothetical protein